MGRYIRLGVIAIVQQWKSAPFYHCNYPYYVIPDVERLSTCKEGSPEPWNYILLFCKDTCNDLLTPLFLLTNFLIRYKKCNFLWWIRSPANSFCCRVIFVACRIHLLLTIKQTKQDCRFFFTMRIILNFVLYIVFSFTHGSVICKKFD